MVTTDMGNAMNTVPGMQRLDYLSDDTQEIWAAFIQREHERAYAGFVHVEYDAAELVEAA